MSSRAQYLIAQGSEPVLVGASIAASTGSRLVSFEPEFFQAALGPVLAQIDPQLHSLTAYGQTEGTASLRNAIVASLGEVPRSIVVTDGAGQALQLLFACLLDIGDEVLIPSLHFPAYPRLVQYFGGITKQYQLVTAPAAMFDCLCASVGPKTKVIVVNSPNNPTGQTVSPSELEKIVSWAEQRGIFVLLDEAYRWTDSIEVALNDRAFLRSYANAVAVYSLGKYLCLPGLRLGYAASSNEGICTALLEAKRHTTLCSCPMSESIAAQLLSMPEMHIIRRGIIEMLSRRRAQLVRLLRSQGVDPIDPARGFYVWAERASSMDQLGLVGLTGCWFGGSHEGRRYCLAVSPQSWENVEVLCQSA
jgi:aspartate/methionine/tyrosine aminotransferase